MQIISQLMSNTRVTTAAKLLLFLVDTYNNQEKKVLSALFSLHALHIDPTRLAQRLQLIILSLKMLEIVW